MHASGENSELGQMLRIVDVDIVTLIAHSPELNPIELLFSVMIQRFVC